MLFHQFVALSQLCHTERASEKRPATMPNLPDDVLSTNIFIRLPAKQLAQMRSLSKPWNAFLSHPDFVKSHMDQSIRNNDEIFMVFRNVVSFNDKPFTLRHSRSPDVEVSNFIKFPVPTPSEYAFCVVIGSFNGLICFSNRPYLSPDIHIWNPSLSALSVLPPYTIAVGGYDTGFRFGFDPKTGDYKVLKYTSCDMRVAKERRHMEVYSMRKGSWEIVTERYSSKISSIFNADEVCVDGHDGHLHWIGCIFDGRKLQTIVTFDLGMDTFSEISFPDSMQERNENRSTVLGFMTGKLCVMASDIRDGKCEVWVMDVYGVAESWVKHDVLSLDIGIYHPFGFTSNNEFYFAAHDKSLALYDSVAGKVKSFKISTNGLVIAKFVKYVESLVWIPPPNRGINMS